MAKVYGNRKCAYELAVVDMVLPMAPKQFNFEKWLNASGVGFLKSLATIQPGVKSKQSRTRLSLCIKYSCT